MTYYPPGVPYQQSPPAQIQMLIVVAYDIANPKRHAKGGGRVRELRRHGLILRLRVPLPAIRL